MYEGTLITPTTGLRLYYRDWGGGHEEHPAVLLLHGLASVSQIYDRCAPLLATGRRVVAYDQRGHGQSERPDHGYAPSILVADGMGLASALGIAPPYIVVGHSWGASVALAWAVAHPDLVRAAVLVDGGVSSFRDIPGATWQTIEERFAPPTWQGVTFEGLLARARAGDLSFLDEGFRRAFFAAMTEPNMDGTVHSRLSRENHLRILRTLWEYDLDAAYRVLRRPSRALLALPSPPYDEHLQQRFDLTRAMAARRTAAQPLLEVRWLDDTIHDIPLQRPEALAAAIADL